MVRDVGGALRVGQRTKEVMSEARCGIEGFDSNVGRRVKL